MMFNGNYPDVVIWDDLLGFAEYLILKHSVDDGVSEGGTFNMDNPVAYTSLRDSMNNREDIVSQGQMLKMPDTAEFNMFLPIYPGN